jgi:hypothetical protein
MVALRGEQLIGDHGLGKREWLTRDPTIGHKRQAFRGNLRRLEPNGESWIRTGLRRSQGIAIVSCSGVRLFVADRHHAILLSRTAGDRVVFCGTAALDLVIREGRMPRRYFTVAMATGVAFAAESPVIVPVRRMVDARAKCTPEQLHRFWWNIWPEAVRDFNASRIHLQTSDANGEIRRSAGDRPIFIGLERGVINLFLTDHLPLYWDNSRALAGVTTIYDFDPA